MSLVTVERKNGAAHVTLANPPLNILTCAAMKELTEAFRSLKPADRVAVLRGAGKHLSAGADISEHFPDKGPGLLETLQGLLNSIAEAPVPVVAVARGACLGAGLELAAACDLVIAADEAKLGVPEITLGVFPPAAAVDLPRRVGATRAAELVYTGRTLSGKEAAAWGLANDSAPDSELDARVEALVAKLAGFSGAALGAAKTGLRAAASAPNRREAYAAACRVYLEKTLPSKDNAEGLKAFLEKRKPKWEDA